VRTPSLSGVRNPTNAFFFLSIAAPGTIPRNIPNAYTASGQRARSAESAVVSHIRLMSLM
jgi:hypothetical protein